MKERLKKRFFECSQIIGVTTAEHDIIKYCRDVVKPLADSIEIRTDGTLIAKFVGKKEGPKLQIDAHVDEIGIIVRYIDPNGYIYFDIYGTSMKMLVGARVVFNSTKGYIYGCTTLIPGHAQTPAEANSIPAANTSCIDVGANSLQEVLEMGIDIGTTAVIEAIPHEMYNKDLIMSKAIDNRMGVSYLLEMAHDLKNIDFAGTIYLTFSTTEEMNSFGASHSSKYIDPDWAIVLDTIPVSGTPGIPEYRLPLRIGKGPVFSYSDQNGNGAFRISNNRKVIAAFEKESKKLGIPYQKTSMYSSAGYVTNTAGIMRDGNHCPTAAIATPRKYSHSPVEIVNLNDCVCVYNLLTEMIKNNGKLDFSFLDE